MGINAKIKKVVIYGIGNNCSIFLKYAYHIDFEIIAYADKNKAGQIYLGHTVVSPESLWYLDYDELFLTINLQRKSILNDLKNKYGVSENKIRDVTYLNTHYMLNGMEKYLFVFFTDDTDYLNISYDEVCKRNDTTIRSTLMTGEKWTADNSVVKNDCIFIFRSHCYEKYIAEDFFTYISKKYRKSISVLLLSDMCSGEYGYLKKFPNFSIDKLRNLFDLVITYHKKEAITFGFLHYELPYCKLPFNQVEETFDLFFVGNAKNRLDQIYELYDAAVFHNLSCRFWINNYRDVEEVQRKGGIVYNKRLSYEEYLREMLRCRCIVDICQKDDETTLRYTEAVVYNKKLLTTDQNCTQKSCYDSKYIRCFNSIEDIDFCWLAERSKVKFNYDNEFSPDKFLQYLKNILC